MGLNRAVVTVSKCPNQSQSIIPDGVRQLLLLSPVPWLVRSER